MNTENKINELNKKAILSTLWIFVLLNITFRDIHQLFKAGFLEEMMTGTVNGVVITEEFMLIAGILFEIPIVMIVLSRVLRYTANRWTNIIAGVLTIIFIIANGVSDLDDIFFVTVQIIGLLIIIWYAWKWPKQIS
ncbi:DUF6326 family protein [Chengkuizengella axinellae]|uniref:DUF6326 family protein n=1 Tax=Chengkuizengella axinellae TaxID=3064388 RepID=A0ABT9J1Q5_9BACL|nr:DUF6326 family protein [Chengkuizengella sp. 2205SS18-9]MDP5274950.1 DUF6326 family protein [Chengkuizengella sp. 2205SS18-9]